MKRLAWLVAVVMLALGVGCGRQADHPEKAEEAHDGPALGGFQVQTKMVTPKTAEEAHVVVIGKGRSSLALYIYDRDGNCVAHDDKATPSSKDDVAVSWFPQKDSVYTQELVNLGPVENPYSLEKGPIGNAPTFRRSVRVEAFGVANVEVQVKGGQRTCVFVEGDHKPVVALKVEVYDPKGRLITTADPGNDLCAVIWYPPEDATYTLRIHNPGDEYNDLALLVKSAQ